jgi:hypothetical protein
MEFRTGRLEKADLEMPVMHDWQATLPVEDFPKARHVKVKPLHRINVDSFSSSVTSIEGYNHAMAFVDKCTRYRWIYDMKTKDHHGKEVVQRP